MANRKVSELVGELPLESRRIIKSMADPKQLAILTYVAKYEERTREELKRVLRVRDRHIDEVIGAALIEEKHDRVKPYFTPTPYANDILDWAFAPITHKRREHTYRGE